MTSPADAAEAAVRELFNVTGWLAASLMPGTSKPYRAPQMSDEKRAEADALARLERAEVINAGLLLGETPPPFDLGVADLLSEVMTLADELAERTCLAVMRPLDPPAGSAFADPRPALRLVLRLLPVAVTADESLAGYAEGRCDSLTYRAHALLGLLGDGQMLAALCPWCGGRTGASPTGGARTLRVRAQLPDGQSMARVDPKDVRWFVVCEGLCEPPTADCGARLRGRPAWPLSSEGEWLAQRLERAS